MAMIFINQLLNKLKLGVRELRIQNGGIWLSRLGADSYHLWI